MRVVDPAPWFGIDSGMRTLTVSPREARTLLAAAVILEHVHEVVTARLGDGHYDLEESFCGVPSDLRDLATDGLSL